MRAHILQLLLPFGFHVEVYLPVGAATSQNIENIVCRKTEILHPVDTNMIQCMRQGVDLEILTDRSQSL